eukprot:scaffold170286_cov13-Tisochrysis_lutea.AAC.1
MQGCGMHGRAAKQGLGRSTMQAEVMSVPPYSCPPLAAYHSPYTPTPASALPSDLPHAPSSGPCGLKQLSSCNSWLCAWS